MCEDVDKILEDDLKKPFVLRTVELHILIRERIQKVWFITNFSVCLDLLPQGFGEGESYKIRNENAASPLRLVQKGLKLFFSYKILSWYVDVDAEMFDQYVLNVKLLGYLINLLQDAKQGPVINVSASLLNMYKYANMQHSTNFWTDWCEVRLEICIALFSSSKLWWYIGAQAEFKSL